MKVRLLVLVALLILAINTDEFQINETCGNYTSKCQCDIYEVDVNGTCMPCMSDHCFLCEFGDPYSCEACSPGYELNDDNECVPQGQCGNFMHTCACQVYEVYYNGSCERCHVQDCFLCETGNPHTCEVCLPGMEPSDDHTQCIDEGGCGDIEACACDTHQVYYEGRCEECHVEDCFLCSTYDPYMCDVCWPGHETNEDGQCIEEGGCGNIEACACDIYQVYYEGQCEKCHVQNCFLCSTYDPMMCDACNPGYYVNDFGECVMEGQCGNIEACACDLYDVYHQGKCMQCAVDKCFLCSTYDPMMCDVCNPGHYFNEQVQQCLEEGECSNFNTTCRCDLNEIYHEGECYDCMVEDCNLCNVEDPWMCDFCKYGTVPNQNYTECLPNVTCQNGTVFYEGQCVNCSVQYCMECNERDPESCMECIQPYILVAGQCFPCSIQFCDQCVQGIFLSCMECMEGYVLMEFGFQCKKCEVQNCTECEQGNATLCSECDDGFVIFNQECTQCAVDNCSSCFSNKPDKCEQCIQGYVEINYECLPCQVDNCHHCEEGEQFMCQMCDEQYYLNSSAGVNDSCIPCQVQDCLHCSEDDPQVCVECLFDYILLNNETTNVTTCFFQLCNIEYCENCDVNNASHCSECYTGLQWNGVQCAIPTCVLPFIFNGEACACPVESYESSGNCVDCSDNCLSCDENGCIQCFSGYYQASSLCVQCMDQCLECTKATYCDSCSSGFYFDESTLQCVALSAGVSSFVEIGNKKIECVGGCKKCETVDTCLKCRKGYYLDQDICLYCHPTCKRCDGPTESDCLTCYRKYVFESNKCLSCSDDNCLKCETADYCSVCKKGYYPLQANGDSTCQNCPEFCLDCDSANECNKCEPGMIWLGDACVQCLLGCSVCNSADINKCISCSKGYYDNDPDQDIAECYSCPTGCKKCNSATECTSCRRGYRLKNDLCEAACNYPCFDCVSGRPNRCLSCYGGYQLNGRNCEQDLTCNSNQNCTACPRNYFLFNDTCESCSVKSTCGKCSSYDFQVCTQCNVGYYLDNSQCTACSSDCSDCLSSSYCSSCADGYYMLRLFGQPTGVCKACSSDQFCATCVYSSTQCTSCLDDYSLKRGKCISDKNVGVNFVLNTNYNFFLLNMNRFKFGICNRLGGRFRNRIRLITFFRIIFGSVAVDANVTVPAGEDSEQTYDTLSSSLEGETFGNMTVTSASVQANGFEPQDEPEQPENINLGFILGLTIPTVIILIVIVVICKVKASESEDDQAQTEYAEPDGFETGGQKNNNNNADYSNEKQLF